MLSKLVPALAATLFVSLAAPAIGATAANQCRDVFSGKTARERYLQTRTVPELKVAAVQYAIHQNRTVEQFFSISEKFVRDSHTRGANLIVFPELHVLDMISTRSPLTYEAQLKVIAEQVTQPYFDKMQALSKELNVSILAGSSPRILKSGETVNTAFLAFPDRKPVLQDKMFMTPDEKEWNWTPGRRLEVFDAPWGRTVILICFDSEFPSLSHRLAKLDPEVILVPSMTADDHGLHRVQWSAQARAVEHYAYVVHTGTVQAKDAEEAHYGQASIITPREPGFEGIVARGEVNAEGLVIGTVNTAYLAQRRAAARIYPAREQNLRTKPATVTKRRKTS